ncbi:MAG: glycosyltransferase family 4 protein [bacterium]
MLPLFRSMFIAFEAFPRPKGASSHMASTVQALAKSYPPVLLLCLGYGDMPSYQQEGALTIIRYKLYHPNMLQRARGFNRYIFKIIDDIEDHLKLCVFRDPWSGYPILSSRRNFSTIFEVNALPSWELPYTYPNISKSHALLEKMQDMEFFCLEHSDGIITVSPITRSALVQLGISRECIVVIHNAAADIFFECSPTSGSLTTNVPQITGAQRETDQATDQRRLPIHEMNTGRWFGYVGSLHPWQGVEVAVEAFALVSEDVPDYKMLILTGGRKEVLKRLKKYIRKVGMEERILLHKPLSQKNFASMLAHLEFTVAPLLETRRNIVQGCCPIKIIESLACGTPVIASDLEATRALLRHGQEGFLVPPEDPRALALAIKHMASQPMVRAHMSRRAFLRAQARFSVNRIHPELISYFNRITRSN